MKQEIKRHLISFGITFLASFIFFLYPAISAGDWEISLLLGAIIGALRSAFKLAWEVALLPLIIKLQEYAKNLIKK